MSTKSALISHCVKSNIIEFATPANEITLHSNRKTPYYFHPSKALQDPVALKLLGQLFAKKIKRTVFQCDTLFTASDEGRVLAGAVFSAASKTFKDNPIQLAFSKNEVKQKGRIPYEETTLFGPSLAGRNIVIIEKSIGNIKRTAEFIRSKGGKVTAVFVSFDRQEWAYNKETRSVFKSIARDIGAPVFGALTFDDLIYHPKGKSEYPEPLYGMINYQKIYGIKMQTDQVNKEFYNTFVNRFDKIPFQEVSLPLISKHTQVGSEVLEIGSGAGALASWMSENGLKVSCIEPAERPAEKAAKKGLKVHVTRFQDFKTAERYDCIVAISSLIHIPRDNMSEVLKKCPACSKREALPL